MICILMYLALPLTVGSCVKELMGGGPAKPSATGEQMQSNKRERRDPERASVEPVGAVDKALEDRIRALVGKLEWSKGVGAPTSGLMIPGNKSAEELVRIGKPTIPYLIPVLTAPERPRLLLASRRVCAVEILGEIGDKRVTPHILDAIEANRRDEYFVQVAATALGRLKDARALPKLKEIATHSFAVGKAVLGDVPEEEMPDEMKWWVEHSGLTYLSVGEE